MKVIGLMKNKKGMELKNGKMVLFIKVNFIMGNNHILEFIFPNRNIYLREWEQNMMNGYGIFSYGKKQLYMGQWTNALRDGYGEVYCH